MILFMIVGLSFVLRPFFDCKKIARRVGLGWTLFFSYVVKGVRGTDVE